MGDCPVQQGGIATTHRSEGASGCSGYYYRITNPSQTVAGNNVVLLTDLQPGHRIACSPWGGSQAGDWNQMPGSGQSRHEQLDSSGLSLSLCGFSRGLSSMAASG